MSMAKTVICACVISIVLTAGCSLSPAPAKPEKADNPGFVKRQKDKAVDVANQQDSYNKEGESIAYGQDRN